MNRCLNCGQEMILECHNPWCKMNKPKLERHAEKFLRALNCPQVNRSVDNYIENEIDRQIEEKHESKIDAQMEADLEDYMQGFWANKGE